MILRWLHYMILVFPAVLTQENIRVFEQKVKMVEHGLLIDSSCATEIAQEPTAGNDHFMRGVFLIMFLPLRLLRLRPLAKRIHHDVHDILVDTQDPDKIRMLEEDTVPYE